MAYGRRSRYPRRPRYNSRRRPSNGYSATAKAATALAVAYGVKRLLNVERKFTITNVGSQLIPDTGIFNLLNGVSTGTTESTRNGNSVRANSLFSRLTFTANSSATNTFVRMIIFWDRQTNSATPSTADLLESVNHLSSLNKNRGKRFKVIHDRLIKLIPGQDTQAVTMKCYKRLQRHIEFDNTDATVASISTNSLFLFFISSEATNTPTVAHNNTFRYIDN